MYNIIIIKNALFQYCNFSIISNIYLKGHISIKNIVYTLRNFVIVLIAVTKHDDEDDEGEDNHKKESNNNSNHAVAGFFGIRFDDLKINLGKA